MAVKNQVFDMTPLGMKFTVLKSSEDTHGKSLDLQWEVLPGCGMKHALVHSHPNAKETYEVLEGEVEFFVKDEWIRARKGDRFILSQGIAHSFRNPNRKTATLFNSREPALEMENYFEDVCKLINKLTHNGKKKLRMNLRTKKLMTELMNDYKNEIVPEYAPGVLVIMLTRFKKFKRRRRSRRLQARS